MLKRILLLLSLTVLLAGCDTAETPTSTTTQMDDHLKIVTTFPPLYSFAANVTGETASITNLVPAGVSIHAWEPKPSSLKAVSEADVLIMNGLELEPFIEDMIESAQNTDLKVIVTSDALSNEVMEMGPIVELEEHDEEHDEHEDEDHEDGHHHEGEDPHVWLSPMLTIKQVEWIRDELIKANPVNQADYEKNTAEYIAKLKEVDQNIRNKISSANKDFIVFHDAYGYFLNAYGLTNKRKASVEPFPGKEPSAKYFKELVELIENENIEVIFTEPQFSPKLVENLKSELSIQSYEIDPIGSEVSKEGYLNNINQLANTFVEALK